jgi:O-methyltransferase
MLEMLKYWIGSQLRGPHYYVLDAALAIQMVNQVEGDFVEFGVFRGDRLIQVHQTSKMLGEYVEATPAFRSAKYGNLKKMRLFGFDSFQGLPKADPIDQVEGQEAWMGEGGFSCSLEEVTRRLNAKIGRERPFTLVKGWFQETLTLETKRKLGLKAVSIAYVDCDFYESAKVALNFLTDLLVDGSVIVFDDWWMYKGRPDRGEQRAFREWTSENAIRYSEFFKTTAVSFIIHR